MMLIFYVFFQNTEKVHLERDEQMASFVGNAQVKQNEVENANRQEACTFPSSMIIYSSIDDQQSGQGTAAKKPSPGSCNDCDFRCSENSPPNSPSGAVEGGEYDEDSLIRQIEQMLDASSGGQYGPKRSSNMNAESPCSSPPCSPTSTPSSPSSSLQSISPLQTTMHNGPSVYEDSFQVNESFMNLGAIPVDSSKRDNDVDRADPLVDESSTFTRLIGSVPIAQYEESPKRYGPKPGYARRIEDDEDGDVSLELVKTKPNDLPSSSDQTNDRLSFKDNEESIQIISQSLDRPDEGSPQSTPSSGASVSFDPKNMDENDECGSRSSCSFSSTQSSQTGSLSCDSVRSSETPELASSTTGTSRSSSFDTGQAPEHGEDGDGEMRSIGNCDDIVSTILALPKHNGGQQEEHEKNLFPVQESLQDGLKEEEDHQEDRTLFSQQNTMANKSNEHSEQNLYSSLNFVINHVQLQAQQQACREHPSAYPSLKSTLLANPKASACRGSSTDFTNDDYENEEHKLLKAQQSASAMVSNDLCLPSTSGTGATGHLQPRLTKHCPQLAYNICLSPDPPPPPAPLPSSSLAAAVASKIQEMERKASTTAEACSKMSAHDESSLFSSQATMPVLEDGLSSGAPSSVDDEEEEEDNAHKSNVRKEVEDRGCGCVIRDDNVEDEEEDEIDCQHLECSLVGHDELVEEDEDEHGFVPTRSPQKQRQALTKQNNGRSNADNGDPEEGEGHNVGSNSTDLDDYVEEYRRRQKRGDLSQPTTITKTEGNTANQSATQQR